MLTTHWPWALTVVVGWCFISLGCGGSSAVNDTGVGSAPIVQDSTPSPPPKSVSHSLRPSDPDAIPVPAGNALQIVTFLNEMAARAPTGSTPEEQNESLARLMDARIRAAEKLLADKDVDESYQVVASEAKLESLRILNLIAHEGAPEALDDYLGILAKSQNNKIAQIGCIGRVMAQLDKVRDNPESNSEPVVEGIKRLFDAGKPSIRLYYAANEIIRALEDIGQKQQAISVLAKAVENSQGSEESQITDLSSQMAEKLRRLQMEVRLADVLAKDGDVNSEEVVAATKQLLESAPVNEELLATLLPVARRLELSHRDTAREIYRQIQAAFAAGDEEFKARASHEVSSAEKRLGLIGTKLELTGKDRAGNEFDPSIVRGKVVLVVFWATTSTDSISEISAIKRVYDAHKEGGLEVVGVNMDTDAKLLKESRAIESLPWINLVDTESNPNPNAELCGVRQLPAIVLANRRGEVVAMHSELGPLTSQVEQLLAANVASKPAVGSPSPEADKQGPPGDEPANAGQTITRDADATEEVPETTEQPDAKVEGEVEGAVEGKIEGLSQINPYAPPTGLSPRELAEFVLEMRDKPRSIQFRDGFREGVVQAADEVLAAQSKDKYRAIAALAKLDYLHRDACLGDAEADKLLLACVESLAAENHKAIAKSVAFFQMERRALEDDLSLDKVPQRVAELTKYLEASKAELTARHLRMASATVELVNRLEDGDDREKHFVEIGDILAASNDKQVARYGRRLGRKNAAAESKLVGTELALTGTTVAGADFKITDMRGSVVLVDFWATWCPPCRALIPKLQELYDEHNEDGLEIVGVSIDQDIDALESFLDDHNLPWMQLSGDANSESADRLGIRGVPTLILVDRQGKVVASGHQLGDVEKQLQDLLK